MTETIQVMGILNVTPDSFFDGGKYKLQDAAVQQALSMVQSGAAIIDVGGESTRPGAQPVLVQEELDRVIPVIEGIQQNSDVTISIDTSKPDVMHAAVSAGATLINDVRALQEENALQVAAQLSVPVCLMHMQGQPRTMQENPEYSDVIEDVYQFLIDRAEQCQQAGIDAEHIVIDPGFGFGKNLSHNLQLMQKLDRFTASPYPVMVGVSRKSMLGKILDADVENRLPGSLALATIAILKGVKILRVHDVKETVDVVKVCQAVIQA